MNAVIEIVIEKIKDIKESKNTLEESFELINSNMKAIDKFKSDPDSIDVDLLGNIVPEELKNKDYNLILKLVGMYQKHANESQVKAAKNHLRSISNKLEKKYEKDKKTISSEIKALDNMLKEYTNLEEFCSSYSEQVYVDEETYNKIYSLLSDLGKSDIVIKFFLEVARNNANIEIEATKAKETAKKDEEEIDPNLEDIKDAHDVLLSDLYDPELKDDISMQKKQLMIKYKDFLENHDYLPEELFEQVRRISVGIDEFIDEFDLTALEFCFMAADDIELIESFDDEKQLSIAVASAILKAHNEKDVKKINEILEYYKKNEIIYPDKILLIESREEEADILKAAFEIKEFHLSRDHFNPLNSYSAISDSDAVEKGLKALNIDSIELVKFKKEREIMSLFDEIEGNIRGRNLDFDLDTKLEKLKNLIDDYNEIEEMNIEINNDNNTSELYGDNFENYIVFLDPDGFVEKYEKMINSHPEKLSNSQIETQFAKLTQNDLVTLRSHRYSRNIHTGLGKPNEYGIKDLRGRYASVGYKVLEGEKLGDHNVIVVILPSYLYSDSNKRHKTLKENIKKYEQNRDKYSTIEKLFSKDATPEEQQKAQELIKEGVDTYNRLTSISRGKEGDLK